MKACPGARSSRGSRPLVPSSPRVDGVEGDLRRLPDLASWQGFHIWCGHAEARSGSSPSVDWQQLDASEGPESSFDEISRKPAR